MLLASTLDLSHSATVCEQLQGRRIQRPSRATLILRIPAVSYRLLPLTSPENVVTVARVRVVSRDGVRPKAFIPERYLEDVNEATAPLRDPRNYIFGLGRRCVIIGPIVPGSELMFACPYCIKCTGTRLVDSYRWLAIACTLATFQFANAMDADGNFIEPQPEYLAASFRCVPGMHTRFTSA